MKKSYLLYSFALALFAGINYSSAAIIEIRAIGLAGQPQSYSPANPTVYVGDTIRWLNQNGTHTSASKTIPAAAATWNGNIPTDGVGYFEYVVTVPGTYNYICHSNLGGGNGHGMNGSFEALAATTGMSTINDVALSIAYPIPFSNLLTIEIAKNADAIVLYNIAGEQIKSISLIANQTKAEITTTELCSGTYFFSIFKDGKCIENRKILKN
jgi:plastocyanin